VKPMVEVRCRKCRRLLVTMDDEMTLQLEQDKSQLLNDDCPGTAGDYPIFRCPKHGRRQMFDRIGYHAELVRNGETATALV
jgi:hypothetical protein